MKPELRFGIHPQFNDFPKQGELYKIFHPSTSTFLLRHSEGAKHQRFEVETWIVSETRDWAGGRDLGRELAEPLPRKCWKIHTWNHAIWCIVQLFKHTFYLSPVADRGICPKWTHTTFGYNSAIYVFENVVNSLWGLERSNFGAFSKHAFFGKAINNFFFQKYTWYGSNKKSIFVYSFIEITSDIPHMFTIKVQVIRNTAHRPSTQASYTIGSGTTMQEIQKAAQIAAKHSIIPQMAPYMSWIF